MTNPHSRHLQSSIFLSICRSHFVWRNTSNTKTCSIWGESHHCNLYLRSKRKKLTCDSIRKYWLIGFSNKKPTIPTEWSVNPPYITQPTHGKKRAPCLPMLVDSHWHLFDFPICSHLRVPQMKGWKAIKTKNVFLCWSFCWWNQPKLLVRLSRIKKNCKTPPPMKKKVPFFGVQTKTVETTKIEVAYSFSETVMNKQQKIFTSQILESILSLHATLLESYLILSYLIFWKPETSDFQCLAWLCFNSGNMLQRAMCHPYGSKNLKCLALALQTKNKKYGEKICIEVV